MYRTLVLMCDLSKVQTFLVRCSLFLATSAMEAFKRRALFDRSRCAQEIGGGRTAEGGYLR